MILGLSRAVCKNAVPFVLLSQCNIQKATSVSLYIYQHCSNNVFIQSGSKLQNTSAEGNSDCSSTITK